MAVLILSGIYLPTVFTAFQRHDDYAILFNFPGLNFTECKKMSEYSSTLGSGRPITAELQFCEIGHLYGHFPGGKFFISLRVLSLLFLIITFSLFSSWLAAFLDFSFVTAVILSTLIFTLPGFHFFIAQAVAASNSFGFLLALLASLSLSTPINRLNKITLSTVLLILTLMTFQPHALFFFVPPAILLILPSNRDWKFSRRFIGMHLIIFLLSTLLYSLLHKFLILPMYQNFHPQAIFGGYGLMKADLGLSQLWMNLQACLKNPKLWNLWFINQPAIARLTLNFMAVSIVVILIQKIYRAFKTRPLSQGIQPLLEKLLLGGIILLGTLSPQLLNGKIDYYRVTMHAAAFLVIVLTGCVLFWGQFLKERFRERFRLTLLIFLAFTTAVLAQTHCYREYAYVSLSEFDFLETNLGPLIQGKAGTAYIGRPLKNLRNVGDEHGAYSSFFDDEYGVRGMIKLIYERQHLDFNRLKITNILKAHIVAVTDQELIRQGHQEKILIDFNELLKTHQLNYP